MGQALRNIRNDAENVSHWDSLPRHALLEIYLNLDKRDQCSMSLANRNWEEVFYSPELWRQISFPLFRITKLYSVEPFLNEKYLVENFGDMVKHLTLRDISTCHQHESCKYYSCFCSDFKGRDNLELLLSKAQLESLTFERFDANIYKLLEMQNRVLNFEIRDAELKDRDVRMLDSWKSQLKRFGMIKVKLDDYILSHFYQDQILDLLCESLLQIEEVEIFDCGTISEIVLYYFQMHAEHYVQTQDMQLKYLKITRCADSEFEASKETVKSWELIALVRQTLEVTVHIFAECKKLADIIYILPPPAFLRNLSIEKEEKDGELLSHLLEHLLDKGYNKTLNEFKIKWHLKDGDLDLFNGFIRRCPKLKISEITNY